jgi:DNA-binding SARP family transcriptional activator
MLLINENQVVTADALIDGLWSGASDSVPVTAANLVSIYVLRLRRIIGDPKGEVLRTRPPGYLLRTGGSGTDVQVFEGMVRDGRRALNDGKPDIAARRLAEAIGLWRGSPLADVPRSALIEAEAERLAELKLDASELLTAAQIACGQYEETVPELRRLLALHPLREGMWLQLMRALDRAGRRAEALDAYSRARAVLADELGVDPGPRLRKFYEQLLAADTADASHASPDPAAATLLRSGTSPDEDAAADPALPIRPAAPARPEEPAAADVPGGTGGREHFGRAITAALKHAGLTPAQAARLTGVPPDTIARWCAGTHLPPLTSDGITALRAVLAACGITSTDQVLAWTDALIRAQAGQDRPGPGTAPGTSAGPDLPVSDAPGYDLCPDPLQARTPAELVQALAAFRVWAGRPSLRDIERACGREISIATISTALRASRLPPQSTVLAIVRGCGGNTEQQQRFATAWRNLQAPPGRRNLYPVPDTA